MSRVSQIRYHVPRADGTFCRHSGEDDEVDRSASTPASSAWHYLSLTLSLTEKSHDSEAKTIAPRTRDTARNLMLDSIYYSQNLYSGNQVGIIGLELDCVRDGGGCRK